MVILENILYPHLVIGLAKSMLALAEVYIAVFTAYLVNGKPFWLLVPGFAGGALLTKMQIWPRALKKEGWRFFLAYSRFGVMHQVLSAYRKAYINSSEKLA